MGNRSNINLVGNTTQGQNVGTGTDVYKGKAVGNILQYKTLSVTGSTMTITCDDDNIYFSAATGSGGGLSSSSNGLNDNGSVVKLGGDLTETTTISGGSFTHDMCFHQLSNFNICNLGSNVNMNANGGKINLEGCDDNCIVVGLGIQLCQGGTSFIQMKNLCPQSSETDVLYINAGGCLFSGASGGGTAVGWSCLTNFTTSVGCGAMTYIAGATNNTVVGVCALASVTTADGNVAIGSCALATNTTGSGNVAIGNEALPANCGVGNVGIGEFGLWANTTGGGNVAIGSNGPLQTNTTGSENIAIGNSAMYSKVAGECNIAIGYSPANGSGNACHIVAIGTNALAAITTGCDNIGIGQFGGYGIAAGNDNIGIGCHSLYTDGSYNIGIGYNNGGGVGDDNIYLGRCAGLNNSTSNRSVFIGRYAGSGVTTGEVLRIGNKTTGDLICGDFTTDKVTVCCLQITAGAVNGCVLTSDASGNASWATGGGGSGTVTSVSAGTGMNFTTITTAGGIELGTPTCLTFGSTNATTTTSHTHLLCLNGFVCNRNVGWGQNVFTPIGGGATEDNTAIGFAALEDLTTGAQFNTAIGSCTLASITTGDDNTSLGVFSAAAITTQCCNTVIGYSAMRLSTTGHENVIVGSAAASTCNTIGNGNVLLGHESAKGMGNACNTIAIGCGAGPGLTTGSHNILIGAGTVVTGALTGYDNLILGNRAGYQLTAASCRNVFIGYCAGNAETTISNKLHIGNGFGGSGDWLVKGCFSSDSICNFGNSPDWNTVSDERVKENITTITGATLTLSQLNPVVFDFTCDYSITQNWGEEKRIDNYSFIAQEFETVFPKQVLCDEAPISSGTTVQDFRTMNTGHLVPLLVKAIQELEARIQVLEA